MLVRTEAVSARRRSARSSRSSRPTSPTSSVLTRDEFRHDQQAQVDQFLTVLIAILALSEIIAILGIINTLALSVFERTRELGLLRVVGMSRRQMRRMVRWESVVIAVLGGLVGHRARRAVGVGIRAGARGAGPDGVPHPGAGGGAVRAGVDDRRRAGGGAPGLARRRVSTSWRRLLRSDAKRWLLP